eukprot:TRINITY_DN21590_c0_g1_i1.p2 TRINITY_DN21590_c0_g1~~TRINITY_DN21590_c0_g1_i1.p2  ORF type:complete len:106 (+),score=0.61 TRINITY_DN21590_c0_g1_i1:188-505(+)
MAACNRSHLRADAWQAPGRISLAKEHKFHHFRSWNRKRPVDESNSATVAPSAILIIAADADYAVLTTTGNAHDEMHTNTRANSILLRTGSRMERTVLQCQGSAAY